MKSAAWLLALVLWHVPEHLSAQRTGDLAVEPDPNLRIGDSLSERQEYSFTDIAAVAVIGDSILVLEGEANEIRIFNHRGTYLGRIGRQGEGPGEFEWPTAMRLGPEGITVVDLRLRRQSLFSLQGELIRTDPLGQLAGQPLAGSAQMRGGVVVVETAISMSSESGAFPERMVILMRPETPAVDTIARYSTGYVPFRTADSYGFLEVHTGSEGDWAVAGDSLLVIASGEPSTVRWWRANQGNLVLAGELALPVQPEPFTADDARHLVASTNEVRRADGGDLLPRSVRIDAPRYWGQVNQLVISDSEESWIQWDRPRSDDDHRWFRIDLQRRQLERVALPPGFRMLAAVGGKLYGFVLDEYDVPVLTVYRLRPE